MFGRRKREDGAAEQERIANEKEAVRDELRNWAYDLKRPYQAAGFDLDAAISYVDQLEAVASGSAGHPWPAQLKFEMVKAINNAADLPDLKKRVEKLQLQYEAELRGDRPDE